MHIHLNDSDISQMPERLRSLFLDWLPQYLKTKNSWFDPQPVDPQRELSVKQLDIKFESQTSDEKSDEKAEHSHVRLTQLFDAGITKRGMLVRVKLKRDMAKKLGRDYINSLEISAKGTIVYDGQEFDKASPLATKVNGSTANGWEYIEVKKNDRWISLDELRQAWRKTE